LKSRQRRRWSISSRSCNSLRPLTTRARLPVLVTPGIWRKAAAVYPGYSIAIAADFCARTRPFKGGRAGHHEFVSLGFGSFGNSALRPDGVHYVTIKT